MYGTLKLEELQKALKNRPIFGYEGFVNGKGEICHKTVIVGYTKVTHKK